jgi:hypothetical protein
MYIIFFQSETQTPPKMTIFKCHFSPYSNPILEKRIYLNFSLFQAKSRKFFLTEVKITFTQYYLLFKVKIISSDVQYRVKMKKITSRMCHFFFFLFLSLKSLCSQFFF